MSKYVLAKIAEIATSLDMAGHHDAAVEVDNLLLKASFDSELASDGIPAVVEESGEPVTVHLQNGHVEISSLAQASELCDLNIASPADFVKAASEKAYNLKDTEKMAQFKTSAEPFSAAVNYLIFNK